MNLPAIRNVDLESKKATAIIFEQRSAELTKRGITYQTALIAHELDTKAKNWLAKFETVAKPRRQALDKEKRDFVDTCNELTAPVRLTRERCKAIMIAWDEQEKRRIAAENAERIRIAKEEMPGVPAIVVKTETPTKIEGQTITYKASCEFMNLGEFLEWILDGERWDTHREVFGEFKVSGIEALLRRMATVNLETMTVEGAPPGIAPIVKPVTANRS